MTGRTRRFTRLTAILAVLAAGIVSTAGAGSRTAAAANPTLYFMYSMNCTFSIVDDTGKTVTSIAPGSYQVDVRTPVQFGTLPLPTGPNDMTACRGVPQFQLSGPGVELFTTMTAGCEMDKVYPETFQANATYVAQDLNQPSVAHASFTTLASGTPQAPVVTYGGGKGKGVLGTDIVGSQRIDGTLKVGVGSNGIPTLTKGGKTVTRISAGRYRLAIIDLSRKTGVRMLGPTSKAPIVLTGPSFKGTKTVTVALTSGRWAYFTSLQALRYFRVG
jgi:hypothetical protein